MATATLNTAVVFNVGSAGEDANAYRIYDAATGGNELWRGSLSNNPDALTQNQFYRVAANQIVVTQPIGTGGATEEFARRELRGGLGPTVWLQLYEGNTARTNRVAVALASWTIA